MSSILKVAKARSLGYQGDPGLFDFLGKAVKGIAGAILPNIPGGSIANKVIQGIGTNPVIKTQPSVGGVIGVLKTQPIRNLPLLPGGGIQIQRDLGMGGGSTAGLKKDGTPRRVKANGQYWKRPSMNFANGRAIRRAARRLEGAEKLFKKVFTIRHGGHAPAVHLKRVGKGR